jgi:hypothetical protein
VELANVIKDLEVQGAGASEVFAKLGSNMDMLDEKVNIANDGLTNTNSIMEEFRLKNDNVAGSIERLSKKWESLTTNKYVRGFFAFMVGEAAIFVDMLEDAVNGLGILYTFATKGMGAAAAERARMLLEKEEKFQKEIQKMKDQELAAEINKLKQMSLANVEHQIEMKKVSMDAIFDDMERAYAAGNAKLAEQKRVLWQQRKVELDAMMEVQRVKETDSKKSLSDKRKLGEEEVKETKKINEKKIKEQQNLMKMLDEIDKENARVDADNLKERRAFLEHQFRERKLMVDNDRAEGLIDAEEHHIVIMAMELTHLEQMRDLLIKHGQDTLQIDEQIMAKRIAMRDEMNARQREMGRDGLTPAPDSDGGGNERNDQLIRQYQQVYQEWFDWKSDKENAELEKERRIAEERKRILDAQLDAGKISHAEYRKSIGKIDEEFEKKQREIDIKQAKRNRAMRLLDAIVNTAAAVTRFLSMGNVPMAIGAGVLGGVQVARILGTKVPEARRGVKRLPGVGHDAAARGLDIVDNSTGQTVMRAEGQEAIISRDSVDANEPIIDFMVNNPGRPLPVGYGMATMNQRVSRGMGMGSSQVNNYIERPVNNFVDVRMDGLERRMDGMAKAFNELAYFMQRERDGGPLSVNLGDIKKAERERQAIERAGSI